MVKLFVGLVVVFLVAVVAPLVWIGYRFAYPTPSHYVGYDQMPGDAIETAERWGVPVGARDICYYSARTTRADYYLAFTLPRQDFVDYVAHIDDRFELTGVAQPPKVADRHWPYIADWWPEPGSMVVDVYEVGLSDFIMLDYDAGRVFTLLVSD